MGQAQVARLPRHARTVARASTLPLVPARRPLQCVHTASLASILNRLATTLPVTALAVPPAGGPRQ